MLTIDESGCTISECISSQIAKTRKLKAAWTIEPEPPYWPRGKKEIDDFISAMYGPGPLKRRSHLKWLRRLRKVVLVAKAVARLTDIGKHYVFDLQPMPYPPAKVFYADFISS